VIKSKNGRPIGEIYQDEPYGWGAYHYGADNGADSMSSREQALAQLKDMHDEYRQKGVTEGVADMDELRDKMQWLMTTHHMRSGEAEEAAYYDQDPATWKGSPWEDEYTDSAERLAEFAPSDSGDGGGDDDGFDEDTLRKLAAQWFNGDEDPQVERLLAAAGWEIGQDEGYDDEPGVFVVMSGDENGKSYMSWPAEELRSDVAEARPDVMRHKGDTTVKVVKRAGKPIGEIGIDAEASPGNGQYYVKLYDGSYDAVGFDTAEEALAELKAAISEGLAEGVDPVEQLRADIRRFAQ
jgi:hypothetical protein